MPSNPAKYADIPPEQRWWGKPWFTIMLVESLGCVPECDVRDCGWCGTVVEDPVQADDEGRQHMAAVHNVTVPPWETPQP